METIANITGNIVYKAKTEYNSNRFEMQYLYDQLYSSAQCELS